LARSRQQTPSFEDIADNSASDRLSTGERFPAAWYSSPESTARM
jgi:hypothetical protein